MPVPVPSRLLTLLLAVLGGIATDTAFPDRSWWPMAYVGVALLLLALRRDSARWAALVGGVWGTAFFVPHVSWSLEATGSVLPWFALALAQAAYIALFGVVWVWVRRGSWLWRRPWLRVVAVAVVWVAVEQLRASWPFGGFPWGALAFSQTEAPLLRLAWVGSAPLVSAVVVVVGALLALAWVRLRRLRVGAASGGLVVATLLVFAPALVPLDARAESGELRVGAVQGNVPTRGAEWSVQAREVTANHAAGTRRLAERAGDEGLDVVLWPESAADLDPRTYADVARTVDDAAAAAGAPLLLGTQRFPEDEDVRYNEMLLWQAGEGSQDTYTKQHPVPFGEYVPYRDLFRQVTPLVDLIGTDMAAGTGAAVMPVPVERLGRDVPVVTGICFEVAYDQVIRDGVLAGGELIIVPTNNASFGYTQESTQQLAMSRFRAVEHGRATVQVSTVGVSAMIDPNGVVRERTGLFTADQMLQELPLRTSLSPAARMGEWPALVAGALTLLGLVLGLLTGPRRRRDPSR
ncbi:apolipoprotein N-acyltransferase [Georgenia sp. 10Sc9-8]|uniref:Apolipoprotein N-acyltransferase n=1 Tax=Georgenia halotolerans TaxID=3028317 RepID=A0ABT5U1S3_9MICO|nr:apolipoprotein N-acyltransferase [Georgenia halotolerans]